MEDKSLFREFIIKQPEPKPFTGTRDAPRRTLLPPTGKKRTNYQKRIIKGHYENMDSERKLGLQIKRHIS